MLYGYEGLKRVEIAEAGAGDIVAVAGIEEVSIGETIADPREPAGRCRAIHIDEPTVAMVFSINDSPFAGREGKHVTSRKLRSAWRRRRCTNVAIRVERDRLARGLPGLRAAASCSSRS